jgi:hypothetical protein
VKKFSFGLERVRAWRAEQVETEKLKLRRLFDERHALEAAGALLDQELAEAEKNVRGQTRLDAQQLCALDAFKLYVKSEKSRLVARVAECDHRIAAQRQRLLDVRRQFRLLERMKRRELDDWNRALTREIDELAAEVHLSQWERANQRQAELPR